MLFLQLEDVSDGSFSEVFWSSSPQTDANEPKQRSRLHASSVDHEESSGISSHSNTYDPWPMSQKVSSTLRVIIFLTIVEKFCSMF